MNNQAVTQTPEQTSASRDEPALLPLVDVIEDATGITLYADLPGVPKDRLNVRVEGETLLIEAATPRCSARITGALSRSAANSTPTRSVPN
jgi:HSP20 family molecular chaperone IbpA